MRLSELLALERGYSPAKARQIGTAAALHDIGKVRIDAGILNKPGKLTPDEFEVMKTHTKLGAEILSPMLGELGETARTICLYHHERWDATGYWGVRAGDLPEYVGIVSVSDVYMAFRSVRPYKPAWPIKKALDYIQEQTGKHFSPELAEAFTRMIRRGDIGL
jgi:putative two-component system response regulator